jgi:hypothetical protein
MIDKINDGLEGVNDFFKVITSRITPNKILLITLLNGFILGLMTTGFLGADSVKVLSLDFAFFVWQFFIICVFSSAHVNFDVKYMQKFVFVGVIGYAVQQQVFAMIAIEYNMEVAKNMELLTDNNFTGVLLATLIVYGSTYCFSNNQARKEPAEKYVMYQKKITDKVS